MFLPRNGIHINRKSCRKDRIMLYVTIIILCVGYTILHGGNGNIYRVVTLDGIRLRLF